MQTILIIEDETFILNSLSTYFNNRGYQVLMADDGRKGLDIFTSNAVNLIILDIMLPELDGWAVCRRIRKISNVPVILLTARSDEDDILLGFELGADDYVTKPFKPAVLLARSKRLLENKTASSKGNSDELNISGIKVNKSTRTVIIDDQQLNLTYTEYEILVALMEHKQQVLSRENLIILVWGYQHESDDTTLNTHIRNLRNKLGKKAVHIKTVIRVGYRFEEKL
ncbi:response regulator transcription factor [Clostridium sp. UBA6640]|uniref:response regulator transcription factor n=1 Tax=Clostridium sp. UBA6640 TaxID=1946370 RepID=UPI0025C23591|nr:response regulator transcription factor [Clostridium sp. UBA6640]